MVRIILCLFSTYKGSRCGAVVSISNIHGRESGENFGNAADIGIIVNQPEMVSYTVYGNKIIFSFLPDNPRYYGINLFIVMVSKKYGFNIGIVHTHMLHPVFFFIAPG